MEVQAQEATPFRRNISLSRTKASHSDISRSAVEINGRRDEAQGSVESRFPLITDDIRSNLDQVGKLSCPVHGRDNVPSTGDKQQHSASKGGRSISRETHCMAEVLCPPSTGSTSSKDMDVAVASEKCGKQPQPHYVSKMRDTAPQVPAGHVVERGVSPQGNSLSPLNIGITASIELEACPQKLDNDSHHALCPRQFDDIKEPLKSESAGNSRIDGVVVPKGNDLSCISSGFTTSLKLEKVEYSSPPPVSEQSDDDGAMSSVNHQKRPQTVESPSLFVSNPCNLRDADGESKAHSRPPVVALHSRESLKHNGSRSMLVTHPSAFLCSEDGCEFETRDKSALKAHKLDHMNGVRMREQIGATEEPHEATQQTTVQSTTGDLPITFRCSQDECTFETRTKSALKAHQLKHANNDKKLKVRTDTVEASDVPLEMEEPGTKCQWVYICDSKTCSYITTSEDSMKKHAQVCIVGMFRCPYLDCTFQTMYLVEETAHLRTHYCNPRSERGVSCGFPKCDHVAVNYAEVKIHQRVVHAGMRFRCENPDCSYVTDHPRNLKAHVRNVHSTERLLCKHANCNFETKNRLEFSKHMRKHTQRRYNVIRRKMIPHHYVCTIDGCPYATNTIKCMTAHKHVVHERVAYMCKIPNCTFSTKYKGKLKYHERSHKAFRCRMAGCTYETDILSRFENHRQRRHVIHKYVCDIPTCDRSFRTQDSLRYHRRHVHNTSHMKSLGCAVDGCVFRTSSQSQLATHSALPHPIARPFVCDFPGCTATFKRDAHLDKHRTMGKHNVTSVKIPEKMRDPSKRASERDIGVGPTCAGDTHVDIKGVCINQERSGGDMVLDDTSDLSVQVL